MVRQLMIAMLLMLWPVAAQAAADRPSALLVVSSHGRGDGNGIEGEGEKGEDASSSSSNSHLMNCEREEEDMSLYKADHCWSDNQTSAR